MITHTCDPSLPCALCRRGMATLRGAVPPPDTPARCARLELGVVRVPGSARSWRRCTGGYGSQTGDARHGLVCSCTTPSPHAQVWRVGAECGPACPGYTPRPQNATGGNVAQMVASPVTAQLPQVTNAVSTGVVWAYGVTTVSSRRNTLLPRTLRSLAAAGFDAPRLFADDCPRPDEWAAQFGLEVTGRYPTIRPFANWYLALQELYTRQPHADRYAIFQDDLVCAGRLREYLDGCPYPERGYWNLYTFPKNELRAPKEGGWFLSDQKGKGAVGLVFDVTAVVALLNSPQFASRPRNAHRGHRNIDGGVVDCLKAVGIKEWVHSPSLVQHTGLESSMGNRRHPLAPNWLGEGVAPPQVFSGGKV